MYPNGNSIDVDLNKKTNTQCNTWNSHCNNMNEEVAKTIVNYVVPIARPSTTRES